MAEYKPAIAAIAEICARKKVRSFILSPGSRCAPLALSFLRHPDINCRTVTDERSAAFIALGIAQQTQIPTGLVCTSGTAVLNYAPAITEAFYQKIPLLVFTADRPPEWIDQFDNQSIRQAGIYGRHCLGSFELPVDHSHPDAEWHNARIISEAINLCTYPVPGPVHINVPLREPLYPEDEQEFVYDKNLKIIDMLPVKNIIEDKEWQELTETWNSSARKLIIVGMNPPDNNLAASLGKISENKSAAVISDITSNIYEHSPLNHADIILGSGSAEIQQSLKPDLLISCGGPIVSKYTKLFIRKYKPSHHWHIQTAGLSGDTFQSLTKLIPVSPSYFFEKLATSVMQENTDADYSNSWLELETKASALLESFMEKLDFNEFSAIYRIIKSLPGDSLLQLGNSMPIRYANFISMAGKKNIKVNSNRGTSGIDGTISTTVGAAVSANKFTTLIAGDLAFFYDRNGLWNNFLPPNLRIIILNNHGGGIFRILEGSGKLPELDEYFETKNNLHLENSAKDFNLEYYFCNNFEKLDEHLKTFFNLSERPKILEIETDAVINTEIFNNFKELVKNLN